MINESLQKQNEKIKKLKIFYLEKIIKGRIRMDKHDEDL